MRGRVSANFYVGVGTHDDPFGMLVFRNHPQNTELNCRGVEGAAPYDP